MREYKKKVLPLNKIKANQDNPRTISESKLKKLVNSLLVFPKMMLLRPITVDENNFVLGGNMRQTALGRIAQMTLEELQALIETLPEFNELPDGGHEVLEFWEQFLQRPQVEVQIAEGLSDEEKKQFIIKDNVSFGDWDYDELENWDQDKLEGWGVDTLMPDFGQETGGGNLPPELQGVDIEPAVLDDVENEDLEEGLRVIIVYRKEEAEQITEFLGLNKIEKITYQFSELKK